MTRVLSFPIQLAPGGQFAKVDTEEDIYKAQQISAFVRTEPGERVAFTDYGTDDPTFDEFNSASWVDRFNKFYKPDRIKLNDIQIVNRGGAISAINVRFE